MLFLTFQSLSLSIKLTLILIIGIEKRSVWNIIHEHHLLRIIWKLVLMVVVVKVYPVEVGIEICLNKRMFYHRLYRSCSESSETDYKQS